MNIMTINKYVIQLENSLNHSFNIYSSTRIIDLGRTMNLSYSGPDLDMYYLSYEYYNI